MSVYEAAKDAFKLAQKVDNIELVQKLLDVQQQALLMQEKQQELQGKIVSLGKELEELREVKKFEFASDKKYLIDPEHPKRHLCPVCTIKVRSAVPLGHQEFCRQCEGIYQ